VWLVHRDDVITEAGFLTEVCVCACVCGGGCDDVIAVNEPHTVRVDTSRAGGAGHVTCDVITEAGFLTEVCVCACVCGGGCDDVIVVNEPHTVRVDTSRAGGAGHVTCDVITESGSLTRTTSSDDDDVRSVTYTPTVCQRHDVYIYYGGMLIPHGHFTQQVCTTPYTPTHFAQQVCTTPYTPTHCSRSVRVSMHGAYKQTVTAASVTEMCQVCVT